MLGGFTDLFIKRPVLATVIALVILMLGLRSLQSLNVREYPESSSSVVTIATPYPGANAEVVKGFITTPLEQAIASAAGIDFLESTSIQGVSSIQAHLELNYNPDDAVAQILTKINQVRNQLPEASEDPAVTVTTGSSSASMYIAFTSDMLAANQVTDYLIRAVRPRLESIEGVQQAQILGGKVIAMRVWLNPNRMAALAITPTEVREALAANNFVAAVGDTKGSTLSIKLDASTSLHSVDDFERLVVRRDGNTLIRLRDVARVELGAESYDTSVFFQGNTAVFMAIEVLPTANPLTVIGRVRDLFPDIKDQLPRGIEGIIVQDNTVYIRNSINEVLWSLGEALLIVTVVIYLFLGSLRSALIPAVAMPLSLIGAFLVMLLLGFSINLLTLLALILAIGTVVDDGIVVAENAHRHIEKGTRPFTAAIRTGRELAGSIVAMNIVVLAVFAPIAFMQGLTGTLFVEFAFTIAGATLISGLLALTLSPMMCAKLLKSDEQKKGVARWIDAGFERVASWYAAALGVALKLRWIVLAAGGVILVSNYFLYSAAENELAPTEDQGFLIAQATGDPNISLPQLERWTDQLDDILAGFEATEYSFVINGAGGGGAVRTNSAFAGMALKDWGQRQQTQMAITPQVQRQVASIAGLDTVVFPPPSLPGAGGGLPVQLVIGSTEEPRAIFEIAQELRRRAMASGKFQFVDSDLKYDQLQMQIDIDRAKAAAIGLDMRQLGLDLATMLSQGYVNYFSLQGRSYRVIPQVDRAFRLTPEQLTHYYVRADAGQLIPMATVVSLEETVQPRQLLRFNQLNSATISGVPAPGVALGEAVEFLRQAADATLPQGYVTDWAGQSRQYVQESTALVTAFFLAIILIYLVLAAQYESFRDPLIMLVSVPMSIAGALIFFVLGIVTVNIYTQVGLLALIGSIIRHGILLVEFGNQVQREQGLNRIDAIQQAAAVRFRAIMMTTIATLVGMIPLLLASGPGAESRFAIGFVLGAGLAVGTVFTLFVVPALYTVIAKQRAPQDEEINPQQLDQEQQRPSKRREDMEPQRV